MARNIFLSFLGTGNYVPVQYYIEDEDGQQPDGAQFFVQKALLDFLGQRFTEDDQAYIFLTPQAKVSNWQMSAEKGGLEVELIESKYPFQWDSISVSGETKEKDIWETFKKIYDCLQDGDQVYLDITHSWRYLPLLTMALLNYAKALKKIEVKAIYYGAMERLGSPNKVKELALDDRPVPILNLIEFSKIQEWAMAADDFVRYGNPERWVKMSATHINPALKETKGRDTNAAAIKSIGKNLEKLVANIQTNRGATLKEQDFSVLEKAMESYDDLEPSLGSALEPILTVLKQKVTPFFGSADLIWLESAKWCLQHDMIQQGITQLQEGLLTWLCSFFNQRLEDDYFDWKQEKPRNFFSSLLRVSNLPEEEWRGELKEKAKFAYRIKAESIIMDLEEDFNNLSNLRNDINHGGYTKQSSKHEKFKSILERTITSFEDSINKFKENVVLERSGMVNLSNHSSDKWTGDQLREAKEKYGKVIDILFPMIDPEAEVPEIEELAGGYIKRIIAQHPKAVHIMGEMTFTFKLVAALQQMGIDCLASTTKREVVEEGEGKKTATFQFVQFRPYPQL